MKLRPLSDRVIVKPALKEEMTKAGIIVPDTVDKERPEIGKVVAVGEGKTTDDGKTIPLKVKVGNMVLFAKYGPDEVKIDNEEYLIVSESNILAIIK